MAGPMTIYVQYTNFRTLMPWVSSEMSPRSKLRYFRFAMLRAAAVALKAGTITTANYQTIYGLFNRPYGKGGTTGKTVDLLDQVAYDLAVTAGGPTNKAGVDWYKSLAWLENATRMTALLSSISTRTTALSGL